MNWATNEVVSVLTFLLPGFVAATIFYSLTSHPKPSEFGRIIQALAFTAVAQAAAWVVLTLAELGLQGRSTPEDLGTIISTASAIVLALIASYSSNHDTAHRFLRRLGVTKETSYPSEWYSAFYRNADCYVVLHLKGNRRLYGWVEEWPGHPEQGHFIVAESEWLVGGARRPLTGVSTILIPGQEVEMVEFLERPGILESKE